MQKFASEAIWAWEIVCGKVLIVDSYSCFLDFLILSSTSVICVFWRIYPFIQVYLLYCCTCVHNSLLLFFGCQYFLQWCLFFIPDIDIFTYWYFYFFCFFFFLISLLKVDLREPAFVLEDFLYYMFVNINMLSPLCRVISFSCIFKFFHGFLR